ncbi:MAG: thioredoxin-disulfide reductase [Candidatus Omnitrophica bacterium]|nr:thioredoxin-disulfide reductase [Candidatus Omnitrophota bacterium]MBU4149404.1 thioredoxin-disulfide reductase [Candidatus Omnitrophota bacterium]
MDYDVVIIGGGPAGLTAAIYASRARLKTLVVESLSVPGQAILTDSIENYPGFPDGINGFELVERFKKQARHFGAELVTGDIKKVERSEKNFKVVLEKKTYSSLSVIIATGARPKKINIPGEERLTGRGVSYCATCDGPLYKDKNVAVLGGGDSAVEEAIFLTRFAKKVSLIHRRDRLRATKILQEQAEANNKIEFILESRPVEIKGKDKVTSVMLENIKTGKKTDLICDGVFIFVGYDPNTAIFKDALDLNDKGYILTGPDMDTSQKGIFACGDCTQKLLRQVITACGDGATAAYSARQYVEELKGLAYK